MFIGLGIIGLGSVGLHGSLHWIYQSSDEVPMLWLSLVMLYSFWNINSKDEVAGSSMAFTVFGIVQTYVYYRYQHIYAAFLVSFITCLAGIVFWGLYLVLESRWASLKDPRNVHYAQNYEIRLKIWGLSYIYYVLVGSSLWIFELNNCAALLPYFQSAYGLSFHVLWHLGAGMGTYMAIMNLIICRLQFLEKEFSVVWILGLLPVLYLEPPHPIHKDLLNKEE